MKRITFYVCVKDIIKLFDACNRVKVAFTADSDFKILDANAETKHISPIYCLYLSLDDYKHCNQDAKQFAKWLNDNKMGAINICDGEIVPKYSITTVWQ